METKTLDPRLLTKKLLMVAIIDAPVLAAAVSALVVLGKPEIGIALIAASAVISGWLIVKTLTQMRCPGCGREMSRRLTETSFKCRRCQTHWVLPKR
jgi:predicted RNA-binding Zn-ribbon protein involved in translation (DUF1610 family)